MRVAQVDCLLQDQLDLLVGERAHLRTAHDDHADGRILAQQRHAEHGPVRWILTQEQQRFRVLLTHVGIQYVVDVNRPALANGTAHEGPAGDGDSGGSA